MDMELANNQYCLSILCRLPDDSLTLQTDGNELYRAVLAGNVSLSRLNDMAQRILTPYFAHHQHDDYPRTNYHVYSLADQVEVDIDQWEYEAAEKTLTPASIDDQAVLQSKPKPVKPKTRKMVYRNEHIDTRGDHLLLARKAAAESHVWVAALHFASLSRKIPPTDNPHVISLLKNQGILPIRNVKRLGVFGTDATYPDTLSACGYDLFCMLGSKRRYWNGTVTIGGGSGATYADYIVCLLCLCPLVLRTGMTMTPDRFRP